MSVQSAAIAYLVRPRVLHRIPGRMRVHVPLLKRLLPEHGNMVAFVARMLEVPQGITRVAPCLTTGNLVLQYDPDVISDADVLRFLRAVTQLCIANRDRLQGQSPEHLIACEERLLGWLMDHIGYRLDLDGALRIPEDVLA